MAARIVISSKPWVETRTREKDGFDTLFAAYRSAFPAGTTVQDFGKTVFSQNNPGKGYTVKNVEEWIFRISGKRFPFDPRDNPHDAAAASGGASVPDNQGWSHFGEGNVILLPDVPRPGAGAPPPPATTTPPLRVPDQNVMGYVALAAAALFLLLGLKKDKSKKD